MSCSHSKAFTLGIQYQMQLMNVFKCSKIPLVLVPLHILVEQLYPEFRWRQTLKGINKQWGSLFRRGEAVDFISHWNLLGINELKDSRRTACSLGPAQFKLENHKLLKYIHRAQGLKTGCGFFCSPNYKPRPNAFTFLTALLLFITTSDMSALLSVLPPSPYCQRLPIPEVPIQTKFL